MIWWIIGIAGFIIYIINKSYKEDVQTHVSNVGGMLKKYAVVITYLKNGGLSIQKVTKSHVMLSSKSMIWTLDYVGGDLEVRMKGYMPLLGNINRKWIFPNGYSQEKMIEEFENYLDWQIESLAKAAENSPYKYLNDK